MENCFPQHFILNPVSLTAPGLVGCDEELGDSRLFQFLFFFFFPEETEEGKKAVRAVTPACEREAPRGLLLPGWRHRGPSPAPWGHILACQRKQSLFLHGVRGMHGGRTHRGRQLSHGCSKGMLGEQGPPPCCPPEHPCPPCGAQMGPSTVQQASPPAIKFSSFPSSFSSEAALTFISIFSLAAAAFVPGELFWRMPLTEMCFLIP